MKIVFLSNYYNHHQKPFCEAMCSRVIGDFKFISTREMGEERRNLGYMLNDSEPFVEKAYTSSDNQEKCFEIIGNADVVIFGSASEIYIRNSAKKKRIILRYSERLFKKPFNYAKWPIRFVKSWMQYATPKNQYLLCASAYAAGDFAVTGNFINKAYKWGYFPETVHHNLEELMQNKNRKRILWCGRFIDWKHPEAVISLAKRLREEQYDFVIECIGTGEMKELLTKQISDCGLENHIRLLGAMKPQQVRKHMDETGIYLFTSDFHEGWGAVLNESMNSGCAVVASHAIGAVPFLLKNGENGLVYQYGNDDDLYLKVKYLLDYPKEQERMGKVAYKTITTQWNAETAAERLLRLIEELKDHGDCNLYDDGPCSKANIIRNDWFGG